MRRVWWHLAYRFYEARANRALNLHHDFKAKAEKFFRRIGGGDT